MASQGNAGTRNTQRTLRFLPVETYPGPKKDNHYIITLKHNVDTKKHLNWLKADPHISVTYNYSLKGLNAYAGTLSGNALNRLRESSEVESISEDCVMRTLGGAVKDQSDAPWGISRICRDEALDGPNALKFNFDYKYRSDVEHDVVVYVLDTGINTHHDEFEARAEWGTNLTKYDGADVNGHGTHVAGIIAGRQWGVAKGARLVAVKVLGDEGFGYASDVIQGLCWAQNDLARRTANGRSDMAGIVNMSLGGPISTPIDRAVAVLTNEYGIHVVTATTNNSHCACACSPARVSSAITVGASTFTDSCAWFSDRGSPVDIFAPGVFIMSASSANNVAMEVRSGTSMAAAHVSGLVAYLVNIYGNTKPSDMKIILRHLSLKNALKGISDPTVNLLARNDINNANARPRRPLEETIPRSKFKGRV